MRTRQASFQPPGKSCPSPNPRASGTLLACVMSGVLFQKLFLVLGQFLGHEDRIRSASGNAGAAIDTTLGVDIHLSRGLKSRLVFLGMNAVGRADFYAELVLDAGVSDHVRHGWFS